MRTTALCVLVLVSIPAATFADLCATCRQLVYTSDTRQCPECRQSWTKSGGFPLCGNCSRRLGLCEACRRPIGSRSAAPDVDEQSTRIDPNRAARYRQGPWQFELTLTNEGTKRLGRRGRLLYDGKPVPTPANVGDYFVTPWGRVSWVGPSNVDSGPHDWIPTDILPRELPGRMLPRPSASIAPAPPRPAN